MGWGDVRHCFAMAILVLIIIITSPQLLSGDVLLFYVSFSLLFLLWLPNEVCETYYFCSVSYYYYYYYITPTIFG